jgi:hypothetical protein
MPDDAPVDVVYLRPAQPPAQVQRFALIGGNSLRTPNNSTGRDRHGCVFIWQTDRY